MPSCTSRQWLIFDSRSKRTDSTWITWREIVSLRNLRIHRLPQSSAWWKGSCCCAIGPSRSSTWRRLGTLFSPPGNQGDYPGLAGAEEDHCRWLQELEACVEERREFRLATDPHKCKFGQWYDKLLGNPPGLAQLTNSDLNLTSLFEQLDQPHKLIHAVAQRVLGQAQADKWPRPDESWVRRATRNCIHSGSCSPSAASRSRSSARPVVRVHRGRRRLGGLVDRVSEVVSFSDDQIRPLECECLATDTVAGVVQWGAAGRMVQLLNVPGAGPPQAESAGGQAVVPRVGRQQGFLLHGALGRRPAAVIILGRP